MTPPTLLERRVERLTEQSRRERRFAFTRFDWPEALDGGAYWLTPELLTVAGTAAADELTPAQLLRLAQTECVNLFSLSVHGIKNLMQEVIGLLHTEHLPPEVNGYLHHFLEEENQHMWFFAEFCRRYAGTLYRNMTVKLAADRGPRIEAFLTFSRILIFEEIGDHYNRASARDARVHPFAREINQAHHDEEARHIAFGLALLERLGRELAASLGDGVQAVGAQVGRYMKFTLESLYNTLAYRDAGLERPLALRNRLLADPARRALHARMLQRTVGVMRAARVMTEREVNDAGCF